MTDIPPVPPGNQSPYPIHEAPHAPARSTEEWAKPEPSGWSLGRILGAAAGVAAIAIGVAAVLFPREGSEQRRGGHDRND